MLRDASQLERYGAAGVSAVRKCVSDRFFYHENLPEILSGLIGEFDLDPEELHLEITETACARDSEQLLRVIKCLKQKGFIIEMDDFEVDILPSTRCQNCPLM